MKAVKIISFLFLLLMTLFCTPPLGIIFIYMALHENKDGIKSIIEEVHPGIEKIGKNISKRYAKPRTMILLSIFFIATLISFSFLASHLNTPETDDYVNYIFVQMALTGIFASGIVAIAWVLLSLKSIFKSLLAKVLLSLVVSACIIFSRLGAVEFFSANFPFPPSYMPFSFGLATLISAFSLSAFAFAALAIIFEFIFLSLLFIYNFKKEAMRTLFFFAISLAGFIGSFSAALAIIQGTSNKGQLFMIKAAERYDFTQNHMCQAREGETVLFIDNVADRAIAATFPPPPKKNKFPTRKISDDILKSYLPTDFRTIHCNPLAEPRKEAGWCENPRRYGFCDAHGQASR
ncbi:hypothetical protein [Janthinobacterium sp. SUN137]|uniref:hypothetical protein n=1 Tax=Janthinobacterium sp. SUN137 TaxID=3014789 RepID=UPI002713D655|nr:hypothetical protein [Janthinobacterium sp. SUN137]MDO8039221.1 hypothetical protein [Janthinobacterium sp. SUN137]